MAKYYLFRHLSTAEKQLADRQISLRLAISFIEKISLCVAKYYLFRRLSTAEKQLADRQILPP